jgi:nicotinate-nucleotide pyrophosphorylase (carboxylating)
MGLKSVNRLEPTPRCKSRPRLVKLAYDRSFFLIPRNPEYIRTLEGIIGRLLIEDAGSGDVTSNGLLDDGKARAAIVARENGVLAGGEELEWLCSQHGIVLNRMKKDGDRFKKGERLFECEGPKRSIFLVERTGLNLVQRMSGIATETRNLVSKLKRSGCGTIVAGTRKTQWGYLDKKAITLGGGYSHRLGLFESFLIKRNHLNALKKQGVKDVIGFALEKAWELRRKTVFIEIEAESRAEAMEAALKFKELQDKAGEIKACIIMLDNMTSSEVKKTIIELKEKKFYDYVLVEASGGISRENIVKYANAGVDACSLGSLTHSARSIDIGQVAL